MMNFKKGPWYCSVIDGVSQVGREERVGIATRQMLEWILQVVLWWFMVGSLADLSLGSLVYSRL